MVHVNRLQVELESHVGFAGGLRGGGGGGVSAPYIATLTLEALFHVATRMPADSPDAILNKVGYLSRVGHDKRFVFILIDSLRHIGSYHNSFIPVLAIP